MQISVTFRHIDPSDALKAYALEKISRVKKYLEEPIEAHVILKVEKFRHIAEVSIDANGLRFNGTEQTDDMYSSIDRLADTLEGQVRKTKEKVRRRKAGSGKDFSGSTEPLEDELDDDSELRIVMTEQVFAKPMDIDEAALQLKHSSGEFMVFTNRHTMRINVLYRRKDGQLGLIDTVA